MYRSRFIRDLLTEKDNETFEIVRVSVGIASLLFPLLIVGGCAALLYGAKPSDLSDAFKAFGTLFQDFGIFLGSAGVGLFLKRGTESDPPPPQNPQ